MPQRYYPQQSDPRLNEDLRLVYQMAYDAHERADQLHAQLKDAHAKLAEAHKKLDGMAAKPDPGGPSTTRIAGLYVKGTEPVNGANSISTFTGLPVLAFNKATGQIEWYTHT